MIALRDSLRRAVIVLPLLLLAGPRLTAQDGKQKPLDIEAKLIKGAEDGNVQMQLELGIAYLTGKHDIKTDPRKAFAWLQKAAEPTKNEAGQPVRNPRALLYVGLCYDEYYKQLEMKQNQNEALKYYLLAVENGLPQANHYVAFTYRELGQDDKAADYFRAAADFGNQICQLEYARILLQGRGVKADPVAARKYLRLAARNGSQEAQHLLDELDGRESQPAPVPATPETVR